MNKNEIEKLIKIYEEKGYKELINYLYQLKNEEELKDLQKYLISYMHLTNEKNNSLYYNGENEQIITNNTSSFIYFNKNIFSFKIINNRKIVSKESLEVNKDILFNLLINIKTLYDLGIMNGSKINDVKVSGKIIEFKGNGDYQKFNHEECELIRNLLINPTFKLSSNKAVLYAHGLNGYAYILGLDEKEKYKQLTK